MAIRLRRRDVARCLTNLSSHCFGCRQRALASLEKAATQAAAEQFLARKGRIEKLWREFFVDPSQWWDSRAEKVNPRYPDFKHKKTEESLWVDGKWNPSWVEAELSAMAPGMLQVDLFTWTKRLARYVKTREYEKTMQSFQQMQDEGMNPDKFTLVTVLSACSSLRALGKGRQIHAKIRKCGCAADVYVGNALIDMYAKCGSIEDACQVFNKMPIRDVVSWNSMILGYENCNNGQKALESFQQMQQEQVEPDSVTFMAVVDACASVGALDEGRRIHQQISSRGFGSEVYLASCLVDMYAKCGSIKDAWRVFNKMPIRDVVAWSSLIFGYVKCGEGQKALGLYREMQQEGVDPNPVTFLGVLSACASVVALKEGRHVHEEIIRRGFESNVCLQNSLIDMYAKCGSIEDSWRVFSKMPKRNVVTWNAMILGYCKCSEGQKGLELFQQMQQEEVDPDHITFVGLLNACASVAALEEGSRIHHQINLRHLEADVFVGNALVDMYSKCGSIENAREVFKKMLTRDLVAWNAMLAGYARHGYAQEALGHFEKMCQVVKVDALTFISLLSAGSRGGLVDEMLQYFRSMSSVHNIPPDLEHYTCVVDLLCRAGRLYEAQDLIRSMPCEPDASIWMSLVAACRIHGNVEMAEYGAKQALELDPGNDAGQVLLSSIYAGCWQVG